MNIEDIWDALGENGAGLLIEHAAAPGNPNLCLRPYLDRRARWGNAAQSLRVFAELARRLRQYKIEAVLAAWQDHQIVSHIVAASLGARIIYADRIHDDFQLRRRDWNSVTGSRMAIVTTELVRTDFASGLVRAARKVDGEVVAIGTLCRRRDFRLEIEEAPPVASLLELRPQAWDRHDCPWCRAHLAVSPHVGGGHQRLNREVASGRLARRIG